MVRAVTDRVFEQPILNSPYEYPSRHWELDATGQPTQRIVERRRAADEQAHEATSAFLNDQRSEVSRVMTTYSDFVL